MDTVWLDGSGAVLMISSADSGLGVSLEAPSGIIYDSSSNDPAAQFSSRGALRTIIIQNAENGPWVLHFDASAVMVSEIEVCVVGSVQSGVLVEASLENSYLFAGDTSALSAHILSNATAVTGALVRLTGIRSGSDTIPIISLNDQGLSPDPQADDGVYSGWFIPADTGVYELSVTCEQGNSSVPFRRVVPLVALVSNADVPTDVNAPEEPGNLESIRISQSQPNPFNSSTRISFTLPKYSYVRVVVYDILGREVARLADREMEPGESGVVWDGRDFRGRTVGSGVYFCRLSIGSHAVTRKLVLLK